MARKWTERKRNFGEETVTRDCPTERGLSCPQQYLTERDRQLASVVKRARIAADKKVRVPVPASKCIRSDSGRRGFDEARLSQINRFELFARDKIIAAQGDLAEHGSTWEH